MKNQAKKPTKAVAFWRDVRFLKEDMAAYTHARKVYCATKKEYEKFFKDRNTLGKVNPVDMSRVTGEMRGAQGGYIAASEEIVKAQDRFIQKWAMPKEKAKK